MIDVFIIISKLRLLTISKYTFFCRKFTKKCDGNPKNSEFCLKMGEKSQKNLLKLNFANTCLHFLHFFCSFVQFFCIFKGMRKITTRQQEIYNYVQKVIHLRKLPPTIREIGDEFGIKSTNGVRDALTALARKGFIKKISNRARGIELLDSQATDQEKAFSLPIIGRIAAGKPILAEENIEDTLIVDKTMLPRSSEMFVLRVYGDSMSGDGILDGDLAIIRMQKNAERGQIIAAVIGGDATLKRYHPERNKIELRASNPNYMPIIVKESEDFYIAGILAGVIRKY
jgi:repressor LexA